MATAVQVVESTVPMPSPSGIEHHLRRSTRIRSSPPRPFITVRGSNVDSPSSHGQRSSRIGSSRSRPASHARNTSLPSINSKLLTAAVNPGLGPNSKTKDPPETELLPPPKSDSLPRTVSKRRRGSDLTDRATDAVSARLSLSELDEQSRTPRALRALKRQRLSQPESSQSVPNKGGSPFPLSVHNFGSNHSTPSPLGSVENQNHRVSPNKDPDVRTTDESDAAGILENLVPFRKEETRKHFDSDYPISGKVVNPASSASVPVFESQRDHSDSSSSADSLDASTTSTSSAGREQEYHATSVHTPVNSDTTAELLSIFNSRDASALTPDSENIHPTSVPARAPTPTPTPIDLLPPTPPPLPSPLSQLASFPLSGAEIAHASFEDPDLPEVPPPPVYPVAVPPPVRPRRKSETFDTNIWTVVCRARVDYLIRRCKPEVVQAVVAAQAERFVPTQFHLYTPASYTESDDDLTSMDDVLMDDEDDDEFDSDDDGSDDDDFVMGMDETTADGFDVMNVTVPEDSSSQHPPEGNAMQVADGGAFNEYGQHGLQSPHLPVASSSSTPPPPPPPPPQPIPQLPRLSAIRVPYLEPCPLLTPDGRSYMGRGTPIDRVRRAEWANIRPVYRSNSWEYTLSQEDWFSIFSPAPSTSNAGMPLMPDLQYGVPGPLCCTEQGTYGAGGPMLPSFEPMEGPSTDVLYQPPPPLVPTPQRLWLDPSPGLTVPALPASPLLVPVPEDSSPFTSPHYTTTPSPDATQNQTGCAWHSSFLQCLLASGLGCSPCASSLASPADNMGASSSSTSDAGVLARSLSYNHDRVPVQVSSTLSHALG